MHSEPILVVENLVKRFGGFQALSGIGFHIHAGEILGLVGPNGSGKTTCINVISGLYAPDGGEVRLRGQSCGGFAMHRMARLGVNRTFQIPKPFMGLSVAENVEIARKNSRPRQVLVEDPLTFVGLAEVRHKMAGELNSSQQKRLDFARAVATGPQILLVDELGAGLNPHELEEIGEGLMQLAGKGVGIIVVEHLLGFVNQITKRVIVMNSGKAIFEGDLESAAKNPDVVEVYLGG
ncbi:MAG: ABC transporter ATP-binding protein [Alicyclobacillaceae bacterium]|nr:ABC transporter ATP-binding protein [Alicyclobacillaceae bacterium]